MQDFQVHISDLIADDYAKSTTDDSPISKTWYIPHHEIYPPEKSGKLRVVFNCLAKYKGICLNDILLQGSDIINNLVNISLVFCYVKESSKSMFHQVKIPLLLSIRMEIR